MYSSCADRKQGIMNPFPRDTHRKHVYCAQIRAPAFPGLNYIRFNGAWQSTEIPERLITVARC